MADRTSEPPATYFQQPTTQAALDDDEEPIDLRELLDPVRRRWRVLAGVMLVAGALGAAGSYLVTPLFTSTTTFLPPQQQQSAAASAMASLGALAGLAGASVKSPAEQYISLMQSVTVSDRMIDQFHLMAVYDEKYRRDARKALAKHVSMTLGKKDGLISVAVDDRTPEQAAAMANQYVEELRRMTSVLAVSEAQQRRVFFEKQMQDSKGQLVVAQAALQDTGFTAGALKADPRNAAEQYARLRAEATAAEVKLQTLRNSLAETAPEVQRQKTLLQALRGQLAQVESAAAPGGGATADYIGKYREFKYQETLFDLLSKQYELARVDEAHEGALIQVVDPALPAELKSSPKRALIAAVAAIAGAILAVILVIWRDRRGRTADAA